VWLAPGRGDLRRWKSKGEQRGELGSLAGNVGKVQAGRAWHHSTIHELLHPRFQPRPQPERLRQDHQAWCEIEQPGRPCCRRTQAKQRRQRDLNAAEDPEGVPADIQGNRQRQRGCEELGRRRQEGDAEHHPGPDQRYGTTLLGFRRRHGYSRTLAAATPAGIPPDAVAIL
jgi:hypothetical protein